MKKYIIVGVISALLLLCAVFIILSCTAEVAAYIGTWAYEEGGERAVIDIKEGSFEYMGYEVMIPDGSKGEKQVWVPTNGFRGSFTVSDGVFCISLTEGYYGGGYGWFDEEGEYWIDLLMYLYFSFDAYLDPYEATFELSYSVSGNELTLSLAGSEFEGDYVFTKQ
jgi:hypothetical protein